MTEKICAVCGTYIYAGKYCPNCGQQLYPDAGKTRWLIPDEPKYSNCDEPKFDVWTGKKLKGG